MQTMQEPLEKLENVLNENLAKVHTFLKSWYLTLNSSKPTSIVFHLSNRGIKIKQNRKLNLVTLYRVKTHLNILALNQSSNFLTTRSQARSVHTKKIDTKLNRTMRKISGCVQLTKLQWLPILSNLALPEIRRYAATLKMIQKYKIHPVFQSTIISI